MMHYRDWPNVLKRRWVTTIAMGLLFLLAGVGFYLALNDRTLLLISAVLVLCFALQCTSFYRAICTGNYEITEGLCMEVGKAGLHRQRKVRLLESDGNECAFLLDKRTPIRIGNYYRIYYEDCNNCQRAADIFPAVVVRQILAVENLGVNDSVDCENSIQKG